MLLSLALAIVGSSAGQVLQTPGLLAQDPTVGKDSIAFSMAGDLWVVPREGGTARRLTSDPGREFAPRFSPDGSKIAFSGQYAGNTDAYVVDAGGGIPKRLTFQPQEDLVTGWTPNGDSIVYSSTVGRLFEGHLLEVPADGGRSKELNLRRGVQASFSGDGQWLAYVPGRQNQTAWKRYRGGQTSPIWLVKLADATLRTIPRENSNDSHPMWVGDDVFFLSDRDGKTSLYKYGTKTSRVERVATPGEFEFKTASYGDGAIVLEEFGDLKLYDLATKKLSAVPLRVQADFPEVRDRFVNPAPSGGSVSPNGKRAVLEARGEVFTVPSDKGDARDITQTSGAAERSPAWSPDGRWIAYFSDAGGEYRIVLEQSDGIGEPRTILPGDFPAYYENLQWSPDSKKLLYTDNRAQIWLTDVESGAATLVDRLPYYPVTAQPSPSWSPDSGWIAYAKQLPNFLTAIFLYEVSTKKVIQVTDDMSEARSPVFDRGGKYLYFLASTNTRTSTGWLDLSALDAVNVTSSVYVVVLRKGLPTPFAPESDEEPIVEPKEAAPTPPQPKPEPEPFRIDVADIGQRIVSAPMPPRVYVGLLAGTADTFFVLDVAPAASITMASPFGTLRKFSIASRQESVFAPAVQSASVSANGQHMLLMRPGYVGIVATAAPPQPGQGALDLGSMTMKLDPKEEWRQIFDEVLRTQRDFFYDPNYHGVNLGQLKQKYAPYVESVMSRADLNYLLEDMLGELSVGHMFVSGGDIPSDSGPGVGLLGAEYELDHGRYRFAKVFSGENWNPNLRAPLSAPGVEVKAGEYLLEVDGKEIRSSDDIYERFEGKANRQVRLRVGPNPDGTGSREVTVVPVDSESSLRLMDWVESNRRTVDRLSGGKVAYVWVPNTSVAGYVFFNRYYFAQVGKQGVVVDERYNGGGSVADYFVQMLNRPLMSMWTTRYGNDFASPLTSIYGPRALIINEYAGSGGDYFPWVWRQANLGPIVGKRTWGGLVGILGRPPLIDGGDVTSPNVAFYNPEGKWEIENYGVAPDVEVEILPKDWREGRDPQLETATELVLEQLRANPPKKIVKPKYQDKTKLP